MTSHCIDCVKCETCKEIKSYYDVACKKFEPDDEFIRLVEETHGKQKK